MRNNADRLILSRHASQLLDRQLSGIIIQRTKAGLEATRNHGVRVGRPVVNKQKLDRAIQLYKGGELSVQEISAIVGISRSTLYKYIKDLKEKEDANENSYE